MFRSVRGSDIGYIGNKPVTNHSLFIKWPWVKLSWLKRGFLHPKVVRGLRFVIHSPFGLFGNWFFCAYTWQLIQPEVGISNDYFLIWAKKKSLSLLKLVYIFYVYTLLLHHSLIQLSATALRCVTATDTGILVLASQLPRNIDQGFQSITYSSTPAATTFFRQMKILVVIVGTQTKGVSGKKNAQLMIIHIQTPCINISSGAKVQCNQSSVIWTVLN